MRRVVWLVSMLTWLAVPAAAFAQDQDEDEAAAEAASADEPEAASAPEPEAEPAPDEPSAAAAKKTPQWFVGPYIEGVLVPAFMLDLFLDAAPTVFNPSFGATVTHRNEDGFSWTLGIGYAGYAFDGPFRAKDDPELDTEYLSSSLGLLHVRGLLTWSAKISEMFAFEYGIGVEFGVVLGTLTRSEAYLGPDGEYHPCSGWEPGVAEDPNYCEATQNGMHSDPYDAEGAHYGVTEERVPPIAAALMLPQLALRFAPMPALAIKLEASYGIMQFTFGLSAAYAIDS